MDATITLTTTNRDPIGGFSRATRTALTGTDKIKIKMQIIKKVLPNPMSASLQVSSYDPAEMADSGNFFHLVADWRTNMASLWQHMESTYMHNVFYLLHIIEIDDPANPGTLIDDTDYLGNLFELWHNITITQLVESCRIYAQHAEDVDRENLRWSWELLLLNVDIDLRNYVISETEAFTESYAKSGPVAFWFIANKIITGNQNLAHNIISGVMLLELRHFQGEDVAECCFVLRNVLKFLNHGDRNFDKCPPTILDNLMDVFQRCSNRQFGNYMLNLKDFHPSEIDTAEKLFAKALSYYQEIKTKPGRQWLPMHKTTASFVAKKPIVEQPKEEQQNNQINVAQGGNGNSQFTIDRCAPKEGEPHTRISDKNGKEERWCSRCPHGGRWGNHLSEGHDKWLKEFKEYKAKKDAARKAKEEAKSSEANESGPDSMHKTTVSEANISQANVSQPMASLLRRRYVKFYDSDDEE